MYGASRYLRSHGSWPFFFLSIDIIFSGEETCFYLQGFITVEELGFQQFNGKINVAFSVFAAVAYIMFITYIPSN